MAYNILSKDGRPIKKDGFPVKAMDYTIEKIEQLDEKNKTFIAVASTEDEDRDKDIVRQDGWDLKNFKKNPMIPWSHDYWGVPIAKSLKTWVDKVAKKLMFKPQFDENDDQSMKIFSKYKNGFLKAFSVGFKGIEYNFRDEEDRWFGGIEFLKQELLEISGVTIPANPNAVIVQDNAADKGSLNLLQLGYPTRFAETEHGLFYPVREELAAFVNPIVTPVKDIKGVSMVGAYSSGDSGESDIVSVGYFFDPDSWNTGDIKTWINENVDPTYHYHYYDWKWIGKDKNFNVEDKEEEKEIPEFDEPVKMVQEEKTDEIDLDEDGEETPTEEQPKSVEELFVKINESIEKHLDAIQNGVEKALGKVVEGLSEIKLLLNEKTVDLDSQLSDNDNNKDLENPNDDDKSNSKTDDDVEIDDSLLSPDNDKSNDDSIIELDDDLLSDKGITKDAVNSVFSEKLKETLNEVRSAFKIEI